MSEYYLEIWGRDEDKACRLVGDIGKKTYFATEEARDRVVRTINSVGLLVMDWQATVQDRKHPVAVIVLRHGGKDYTVERAYFPGYEEDMILFAWEENNQSCDCNRSIAIREVDSSFPDMKCGDEIEMVSLRIEYRDDGP